MHRFDYTSKKIDYIGLSTDTKITEGITDGSVFFEADTFNVYIFYNGTWYNGEEE